MASGSTHDLLEPTIIAKEALMLLKNNLVMGNLVHREYRKEFDKIGGTVTIRKPVKFRVTTARTRGTSTITEKSITLQVATQAHVSWAFNTKDLTLTIDQYSERYIKPAVAALANKVDSDILALYKDVYNVVSETTSWSADPQTFLVLGKAGQRMDEEAVPQEGRSVVLNPAGHWSIANALRTVYVQDVAGPALKKGYLAKIANFDVYMDQNVNVHTTGNWSTVSGDDGTRIEVATGAPTGSHTAGTTALEMCDFDIDTTDALKVGDVLEIAGVFAVNPMSGASTGQKRQFVVTAEVPIASTGTTEEAGPYTVHLDPALIDTGPYKTISTMPVGGLAVDVVGHVNREYPQNLAFHKNAFALVVVPLDVPAGASFSATATDEDTGLSIRVINDYDINEDDDIIRLDILYGVKTLYPELACRIMGAQG